MDKDKKLYTVKIFSDNVVHWTGDVFAEDNVQAERVALMKATLAEAAREFDGNGKITMFPLPFPADVSISARSW